MSAFWLASTAGIPNGGGDGYEIDILEFYGGILTPGNPPTYNQPPWCNGLGRKRTMLLLFRHD
jgi:hypothetical protein